MQINFKTSMETYGSPDEAYSMASTITGLDEKWLEHHLHMVPSAIIAKKVVPGFTYAEKLGDVKVSESSAERKFERWINFVDQALVDEECTAEDKVYGKYYLAVPVKLVRTEKYLGNVLLNTKLDVFIKDIWVAHQGCGFWPHFWSRNLVEAASLAVRDYVLEPLGVRGQDVKYETGEPPVDPRA